MKNPEQHSDAENHITSPEKRKQKQQLPVPQSFSPIKTKDISHSMGQNNADTELWLVQVPHGFDVSALDKALHQNLLDITGTSQTVKVKTEQEKQYYSVGCYRDSSYCQQMSMVLADSSGHLSLGPQVQNLMVVSETRKVSHHRTDSSSPVQRKPVPMPSGLKIRFTPFGSGTPCPSVSEHKKSKKRKKSKTSEGSLSPSVSKHKKSKKRKESEPSEDEHTSPKKKRRKMDM